MLAAEGQLEHVQHVEPLVVVAYVVAVEGRLVEEQLDFEAQQQREIDQAEQKAACARHGPFGGGHGAVVADAGPHFGLAPGQGRVGGVRRARQHALHQLLDGGCNGPLHPLGQ